MGNPPLFTVGDAFHLFANVPFTAEQLAAMRLNGRNVSLLDAAITILQSIRASAKRIEARKRKSRGQDAALPPPKRPRLTSGTSDSGPVSKRRKRCTEVTASTVKKAVADAQLHLKNAVPILNNVPGPSSMPDIAELDFSLTGVPAASINPDQLPCITLMLPVTEVGDGARVMPNKPFLPTVPE